MGWGGEEQKRHGTPFITLRRARSQIDEETNHESDRLRPEKNPAWKFKKGTFFIFFSPSGVFLEEFVFVFAESRLCARIACAGENVHVVFDTKPAEKEIKIYLGETTCSHRIV